MENFEKGRILTGFLACDEQSALNLSEAMRAASFKSREFLVHQGETCSKFWLILAGTAQLRAISFEGQNTVLSSFGPGEFIGAFSQPKSFNYDICALGTLSTLEINASNMATIVDCHSDIGAGVSRIYAGQLDMVLDRFSSRVSLSAVGRVYKELLRAVGQADTLSPPPVVAALALAAQTTRETGSRALSNLERRGIIERDAEQLRIISRGMLEDLVV